MNELKKMAASLAEVKSLYKIKVEELIEGEKVLKKGKCSQWARRRQLDQEKDIVYIKVNIQYFGKDETRIIYKNFLLEDSEGYFNKATPPEDYIDKIFFKDEKYSGGLLFGIYQDMIPYRLWFNTGFYYENSEDPVLIDIGLPNKAAETRTQFLEKEKIALAYLKNKNKSDRIQTEDIINKICTPSGIPYKQMSHGYLLKILLKDGDTRSIVLNFKEGANSCITIGTVCCPVGSNENDRTLLKLNPKMDYGAIGISNIKGIDYYVITESYPISNIDSEVICQTIMFIADKSKWLENKVKEEDKIETKKIKKSDVDK